MSSPNERSLAFRYDRTCARWIGSRLEQAFSSTTSRSATRKVEPRLTDRDVLVRHGDGHLPSEPNPSEPELNAQRLLIHGLQQTRADDAMDLQRGVDHDASNLVELPIGFRQFGVFGGGRGVWSHRATES